MAKTKMNVNFVNFLLVVILTIVLLVNVVTLSGINNILKGKTPVVANDGLDVANITVSLIAIAPADCDACPDLSEVIDALIQAGAVALSDYEIVSADSAAGKDLIDKYDLTVLPAMVLTGEVDKLPDSPEVERIGDAILIRQLPPPFVNLTTGEVEGVVDIVYLTTPNCKECDNITILGDQLPGAGVVVGKESEFVWDSSKGKDYVERFNIKKVPTAIFSPDAGQYEVINMAWATAGTIDDGWFVLRNLLPPYYDIAQKKVRGKVNALYVDDASCSDCYDPVEHKGILGTNFGMKFVSEKTVDVESEEGKGLVKKYAIKAVPTVLVQGDTDAYDAVLATWEQVGTVESDGTLVFRKLNLFDWKFRTLDASGTFVDADTAATNESNEESEDLTDVLNQGLQ